MSAHCRCSNERSTLSAQERRPAIEHEVVRGQSATTDSGTPKSQRAREALEFGVVSIKPTPQSEDRASLPVFSGRHFVLPNEKLPFEHKA